MSESYVNLGNARNDQQAHVMRSIQQAKECPFCPENLKKYHKQPVLRQGNFWVLTPNQWPYANTKLHLLAILTYHAETLAELRTGAFEELGEHFAWAEAEFSVAFGGLAMRFGDIKKGAATVNHLHSHLIAPDEDKPSDQKVRFKIG